MRRFSHLLLPLLLCSASIAAAEDAQQQPTSRAVAFVVPESYESVPAICYYEYALRRYHLLVAAWPDGTVVWSDRHDKPWKTTSVFEAEYYIGRISETQISDALMALRQEGLGSLEMTSTMGGDLGVPYQQVSVALDGERIELQTRLEQIEMDEGQLMSSHGETLLVKPSEKEAMLEGFPDDYKQFRSTWKVARSIALSLVPAEDGQLLDNQQLKLMVEMVEEKDSPTPTKQPASDSPVEGQR